MALSRPTITTPGVEGGSAASQGVTASAGSNVQTTSSSNQTLTAGASGGTAGYSYSWALTTKPSGSSASLTSATSQSCTLTGIDTTGSYVATVTVTDSHADGPFTDTASVAVDYQPATLSASAGSNVQTTSSSNQTLSGSASGGTGALSYAWTLPTKPAGSTASITSASSATATLTGIDNGGAYVCLLTVTDSSSTPVSTTSAVVIDYSTTSATGWVDVVDVDFTSATTQSLTDGQENTLTGTSHVFWVDGLSGTGSMTVTNGTGLEVNWEKQNNSRAVFLYKFPTLAKIDGEYPRLRIAVSFSGINMVTNNDYFGLWCDGMAFTGSQSVPIWKCFLKRNSSTAHIWKSAIRTGAPGAGGASTNSTDIATSESTSMVMELYEGTSGRVVFRADEGTTTIGAINTHTFRSATFQPTVTAYTSDKGYWDESPNTGPYFGAFFLSKGTSNAGAYCVIERLVIQKYIG